MCGLRVSEVSLIFLCVIPAFSLVSGHPFVICRDLVLVVRVALRRNVRGANLRDVAGCPVTILDTGTAADSFAVAEESIAVLRKRDGTEMSEVVVAPCTPTSPKRAR